MNSTRTTTGTPLPHHIANPFATRHVRPGEIRPLTSTAARLDVSALLAAIEAAGGDATIVGPHGTGKSTLLAAIAADLAAEDRSAGRVQIRSSRDLGAVLRLVRRAGRDATACLDGWDRLGWGRIGVRLLARLLGCRLVVTSHRPAGLGVSVLTAASLPLLEAIVAELPDHGGLIHSADVAEAYARHGGNLRESLADLYDRFEYRARQPRRF